jgi:isochorismate synthase
MIFTRPAEPHVLQESVETLRAALGRGIGRARAEARSILVSTALPAEPLLVDAAERRSPDDRPLSPLALFARSRAIDGNGFYWERPSECTAFAGIGAVRALTGSGTDCLAQVEAEWQALLDAAVIEGGAGRSQGGMPLAGPLLLGGAAFDPLPDASDWRDGFPAARFVVPRYVLAAQGVESLLTINVLVDPDTSLDHELAAALQGLNAASPETFGDLSVGAFSVALPLRGQDSAAAEHSGRKANMSVSSRYAALRRSLGHRGPRLRQEDHRGQGLRLATGEARPCGPDVSELPGHEPDPEQQRYEDLVRLARDAIRKGDAEKIVLARAMRLAGTYSPEGTLAELRRMHPGCTLFAVRRGDACFLGATPERLVTRRGRAVHVDAIAGTARRGATPDEDARLAAGLLASRKDQTEHAIVVRMIRDNLAPVCDRISVPEEAVVRRLRTVQHLSTPITGTLRGETGILSLAARLHPTPAVGGYPRGAALAFLRRNEGLDRGWYAGPIGWSGPAGDGDFVVGIRSMLLRPEEAVLFAGCGIMADSDPAAEYAESCLKLDSFRSALTETGREHCFQGEPRSRSSPTDRDLEQERE